MSGRAAQPPTLMTIRSDNRLSSPTRTSHGDTNRAWASQTRQFASFLRDRSTPRLESPTSLRALMRFISILTLAALNP